MKGLSPASQGNQGTRLDSLLRSLSDRVRALEAKSSNSRTIGEWSLSTNAAGDLVVTNTKTSTIKVLAKSEE